jgi:hypothetical protein
MQSSSIKYVQTEFNNTLQSLCSMIKLVSLQGFMTVQHTQISIQHINSIKDENHMIILIDAEKAIDKTQHPFMIKALKKLGMSGCGDSRL